MSIPKLSFTEETKDIAMPTQAGDVATLQQYLDDAYKALFASN